MSADKNPSKDTADELKDFIRQLFSGPMTPERRKLAERLIRHFSGVISTYEEWLKTK